MQPFMFYLPEDQLLEFYYSSVFRNAVQSSKVLNVCSSGTKSGITSIVFSIYIG